MIIFKSLETNRILVVEQRMFRKSKSVLLSNQDALYLLAECKKKARGYIIDNSNDEIIVSLVEFRMFYICLMTSLFINIILTGCAIQMLVPAVVIEYFICLLLIILPKDILQNDEFVHEYRNERYVEKDIIFDFVFNTRQRSFSKYIIGTEGQYKRVPEMRSLFAILQLLVICTWIAFAAYTFLQEDRHATFFLGILILIGVWVISQFVNYWISDWKRVPYLRNGDKSENLFI